MPISGEGDQSGLGGGIYKQASKTQPAPTAPAQTPPSVGSGGTAGSGGGSVAGGGRTGGGGAASATQPGRPSGFGSAITGWTGSEADSFFRFLPGTALTKGTTQAITSSPTAVSFVNVEYNDGVLIPDSSIVSMMVPRSLDGHCMQLSGVVTFGSSDTSAKLQMHQTLVDGSTASTLFRVQTAPVAGTRVGFSYVFFVGQGTSAVSFFEIEASGESANQSVASATLIASQVR